MLHGIICTIAILFAFTCCSYAVAATPRTYYIDPSGQDTKDPSVCKFDDKYFLYYSVAGVGQAGWSVGIATSTNLRDWTFAGRLTPQTPIEKKGFCAPGCRVIDGRVHLFYQSYGTGPHDAILHAVSDDGLHFTRDASSPVFRPTGDWTNGRAIDAEVFPLKKKLVMYFATRDHATSSEQMVGIATAPLDSDYSRSQWTQVTTQLSQIFRPSVQLPGDPPGIDIAWEQKCIEGPTLLEHGGKYYLFYGGAYNNHPQQIGVAVSDDAIHFKRMNNGQPILGPGLAGSWNASESGHPGAFKDDDGRDYLFFQGDNTADKIKWHLSMAPIRWQLDPAGGADLPVLQIEHR